MKKFLFLFVVLLFVAVPVNAVEDSFQYYPTNDISANWRQSVSGVGGSSGTYEITTTGATYSRALKVTATTGGTGTAEAGIYNAVATSSNYWSFVVRGAGTGTGVGSSAINVEFYDASGTLLWDNDVVSGFGAGSFGFYEITISGTSVSVRQNGTDRGVFGAAITETPSYMRLSTRVGSGFGSNNLYYIFDDITTSGYISGIGTESTSHTLTESNLNPTNISFTLNTFPFATYTASSYRNLIQKYTGSTPVDKINTTIKAAGLSNITHGFTNYTRETQLTVNDTDYGMYFSYTQKDGVTVATDYFFLVPPLSTDSVTVPDTSVVIGQTETITYTIGSPDFIGSSYAINIYSTAALIQSTSISSASGTVNWDTSGNSAGLYFIVLSKTTGGVQTDLAYTTITLSSYLLIRGTAYDAQNATRLNNVSINFSQGSNWFNTTTDSNGNYSLTGMTVDAEIDINASKTGYRHDNFSFTPLTLQVYTINLYLFSNGLNCSLNAITNTCVVGITEDYPYHQAVTGATVNLGNSSYFASTTSNATTGFYMFQNLSDDNLSYIVNATKSGFLGSSDYNVTTVNGTNVSQIIIMNALYTLTVEAQSAATSNTILSFLLIFNGTSYNTTTGEVVISNLTYGSYSALIYADNYNDGSAEIIVDATETYTFILSPITTGTSSTLFKVLPHDVQFTVQDLAFNKKAGVLVTAQGYNTTVGEWSWLADLLGIDFNEIPINNATMTGTTGTDGSVDFKMDGSIFYILTFSGGDLTANITWSGYPTAYQYIIIVPTNYLGTFTNNTNEMGTISTTVSTATVNSTAAKIFANYSDSMNETTNLTIYINQSILGDINNQTNIQTIYGGTNSTYNATFNVSSYAGKSYIISFVITHNTLGTIQRSYGVSFPAASPLSYFNPVSILMLIVGVVLFFSGFWGQTSTEQGAAAVVGLVWVLSSMGIFVDINLGVAFYLGLTLATVIAILMNINNRGRKEGMS